MTLTFKTMLLAAAATAAALPAGAVTTGTPNGLANGAYVFDGTDSYAEKLTYAAATAVQSVAGHILGGAPGETFTIVLYDAGGAGGLPGSALYTATASYGSEGWNGVDALSGWTVAAGSYWVAFEIGSDDTLGSASVTGALFDKGAPAPFGATAFNPGSGYQLSSPQPLSFGVEVTDSMNAAVPEPGTALLLAGGMAAIAQLRVRRRGRR